MTRVLGLDPGEHIGVALLDVGARQATVVHLDTWEASLGHVALARALAEWCVAWPIVAVEAIEEVHGVARMGSGYAEGLVRCNWIGGYLAGVAHASGLRIVTVAARTWREALCGSRVASDGEVKQMVRLRVPGWPATSNAHVRDAAGVALWAGLAERAAIARARQGRAQ